MRPASLRSWWSAILKADAGVLMNVNMPNTPVEALRGIRGTRLGRRMSAENVIREMSPRGFPIYWLGAAGKPADAEEGTYFWATSHGFVSVTPLQVDLTNYKQVPTVRGWMEAPLDIEQKEN